jgi:hypothetical protein
LWDNQPHHESNALFLPPQANADHILEPEYQQARIPPYGMDNPSQILQDRSNDGQSAYHQ